MNFRAKLIYECYLEADIREMCKVFEEDQKYTLQVFLLQRVLDQLGENYSSYFQSNLE